jgi:hypothetical protein
MTIGELGSIGEFIGALTIVATLLYMARQTNQTNAIQRTLARQSYTEAAQRRIDSLLRYPELREMTLRRMQGEDLSADERLALRLLTRYRLRGYENDFYYHSQGLLGDEEYEALRREIGMGFRHEGSITTLADWEANRATMTAGFVQEFEEILAEYEKMDKSSRIEAKL